MNPKSFLTYGGAVLLALGVLGYLGVGFGVGSFFWLDSGENLAHTVLGIVALAVVFVPGLNTAVAPYYRPLVGLVTVVALFFGLYGLYADFTRLPIPNTFGVANLEYLDDVVHLGVAVWGYLSMRPSAMMAT